MTVPLTHTFTTGQATSSEMNAYVRDPLSFLANRPIARMRQLVAQTLANNTFTDLTFTGEDFDLEPGGVGGHSISVNTARYTAPFPGYHTLSGGVAFAANASNQRGCRWAVNGSAVNGSAVLVSTVGAGNVTVVPARVIRVYLNAGDYATIQGYQNSGGNLDTFVSGEYSCSFDVLFERP